MDKPTFRARVIRYLSDHTYNDPEAEEILPQVRALMWQDDNCVPQDGIWDTRAWILATDPVIRMLLYEGCFPRACGLLD